MLVRLLNVNWALNGCTARQLSHQAVKSVKSKVRELTQMGINPHQAAKMAAASVSGL